MCGGLTGVDIFGAGDRPVGMLGPGPDTWVPQGLTLNLDTALRAATSSLSQIGTGVVVLRYIARSESYSLYLKIERR